MGLSETGIWPEICRKRVKTNINHRKSYCTVGQNSQEYRQKYWATRSSIHLFARTAHSLTCSAPLALLRSLACLLAHFAHSFARGTVNDWMGIHSVFFSVLAHSVLAEPHLPSTGPFAWNQDGALLMVIKKFKFRYIFKIITFSMKLKDTK